MSAVPVNEANGVPASAGTPLLRVRDLRKDYGSVRALRGAELELRRGEVHGLMGQNGCGKSTLLKVLAGQTHASAGVVELDGAPVRFASPRQALAAGIATVTQETTLVPDLPVAENVLLGRRLVRGRLGLSWSATVRRAQELLDALGLEIDANVAVRRLRPDQQQMVEIARALSMDARLLILDEPTSSLTDDEVAALFRIVRELRGRGVSVLFVSHRMAEVFAITDRITVLRDGVTVRTAETAELSHDELIATMIGRELHAYAPAGASRARRERDERLSVRELTLPGRLDGVCLDVAPGEVVGLAGLVGAGRTELMEAIFGLRPQATGSVAVDGERRTRTGVAAALADGIAYVPADRKAEGLVLGMSVEDNLMMAATCDRARLRTPGRADGRTAAGLRERFGVAGGAFGAPVGTLSGGNQQKVLLGKWLGTDPRVLLLNEPTRGVDAGAKAEIYRLIDEARRQGASVLVSSSESEELQLLCHRILVLFRGRVVASLDRDAASEERITRYAMGHDA